jgi:hypothetical protein
MKNKIICLVLSVALLVGLAAANGAYAWFTLSSGGSLGGVGGKHSFATGNVGYILTGDFSSDFDGTKIVPEDELLASFDSEQNAVDIAKISEYPDCKMFVESTSSINTQLRIKVVYGYGDKAEVAFDNSETSPLTVELTNPTLWSYNGGYLYYGAFDEAKQSSAVIPAFDVTAEGATPTVIPLFNSIHYSGENTESSMISGKTLNVKVIFEARQSDFVDWTQVGTIYTSETV